MRTIFSVEIDGSCKPRTVSAQFSPEPDSRKMRFPYKIKHRRFEATIYGKNENYSYYRLSYYDTTGKRRVLNFKKFSDAKTKAAMFGLEEAQRKASTKLQLDEMQYKEAVAKWKSEGMKTTEPTRPKSVSYYVGDATIQAVCKLLDGNPRGLLQKRDELSGWLGGFDQFSKGGNEAAQWLEFHSGGAVKIDRSNDDKPPVYIAHALVSVTGTIQEPILRKLLAGGDAKHFDNGLAARFLMAMPPEIERQWREAITSPSLVQKYLELFKDLLALTPQIEAETCRRTPIKLTWSPEAKTRWVEFYNTHAKEMRAFKDNRLKSAWSKLEGQAARLALVFHCVRETYLPSPGEDASTISADTLGTALIWIEWLKKETRRIYYTLTHMGDTRQADKLIRFARRNNGRCTAAQAARNVLTLSFTQTVSRF